MKRKFRLKKMIALACAATLALSATACGSTDLKTADTTGEIEFWTVFTGPDGENMTKMIDEYNKTNPDFKVKHRPMNADDLYQKVPMMVRSGKNVPDLAISHVERLPLFAETDMLTPMDEFIKESGKIKGENYVQEAWEKGDIDGNRYSIPLDVHSFVTYYNEDLLEKYGPHVLDDGIITFEEVEQVGKIAAADDIKSMGITWMRVKFLGWYAQLGGELSEDGTNPSFANEKSEKVLNTVKNLHDKGYTNIDGEDSGQLFRSGQLVFWPEGIWMKNSLAEIEGLNFGMAHSIAFDVDNVKNWTSSHQMVMFKNPDMTDEKAQGIMDFVAWVGENSIEWARAGQVPASLKILENQEFKDMKQSFLLEDEETLKIFDYKYFGYATEALDKIVWEVPYGRMEAKSALEQAVKEVKDRISNSN